MRKYENYSLFNKLSDEFYTNLTTRRIQKVFKKEL